METIERKTDPQEGKYYELKLSKLKGRKVLCLGKDSCLVRFLFWIDKKVEPINIYFVGREYIS